MTSRKIKPNHGTMAEQGEGAKAERSLGRLGDKAAAPIGGTTESIAKPKLSPRKQKKFDKQLIAALEAKDLNLAARLVDAGANVNAKTKNGRTLLLDASCGQGHGFVDIVRKAISAGADVNVKGDRGWTPLMAASYYGHTDIVQELIAHGADVNARNIYGATPLIIASFESPGGSNEEKVVPRRHVEIARELLKAGADINAKDKYGKTALDHASRLQKYELVVFLKRGIVDDSSSFLEVLEKEAEKRKLGSFENWLEELTQALIGSGSFKDELAGFLLIVEHKGDARVFAISALNSEKETLNYVIVYDKSGTNYVVAGHHEENNEVFGSHDAIVMFLEKVLGRALACSGGGYVDFGPDVLRAFHYSVIYGVGDHAKAEEMLKLVQLHLKKE